MSRAILAVGLASACWIYFANASPGNPSGYELEESKKYLRDMEMIGGKANLLAAELRIWFDGLWHGRSLACTVAVIAVVSSLAYRFFAMPLPAAVDGDVGEEPRGTGKGG